MTGFLALGVAILGTLVTHSTVPMAAYILFSLLLAWPRQKGSRVFEPYRRIRLSIVLQCACVLIVVIAVAAALLLLDNPILNWGWWTLVLTSTANNYAVGGSILAAPLAYPWLIPVFLALLIPSLPQLAITEEIIFRRGTRSWLDGCVRSLLFGLAHLTMGVPLAVALALSVGGLWFTRQYFIGGVERSALHHLTYNCLALLLVLSSLVILGSS
ncbi:MAG: hypothetical protein M1118_14050 [Chloroflexi bacterium]|nr:hypothetical protein [Chloroflexota bacterium]